MTETFASSAAALAAAGWRIHPLRPGAKLPTLTGWQNVASNDAATVAEWWAEAPASNIGAATGNGFFVLDVDTAGDKVGADSLRALIEQHGPLPATLTARTASGGLHYFFTTPEAVRNSAGRVGKDLDIRGAGGYVVVAPSVVDGRAYTWEHLAPMAPAPAWLLAAASAAAPVSATPRTGEPVTIEATPEQIEDARAALAVLDADDRDTWVAAAAALRCLGVVGRSLWRDWSQTSTKWKDSDDAVFYTVAADHSGLPALFARAQAAGWVNPRAGRVPNAADVFGGTEGPFSPTSELANAYRLAKHYGDRLLYVDGVGWHTREAGAWQHDEAGAARMAQELGRLIAAEAGAVIVGAVPASEDVRAKLFKWASSSEAKKVVGASLDLAKSRLYARAADMDADPDLLGTPSAVLDLRTGTVRPYTAADRITKRIVCDFDPNASAPLWSAFVATITGDDLELLDYLQRMAGYMLTGRRGEHLLPVLYGSGANGKSTFLGAIEWLLGDYAAPAPPGLLIQSSRDQHATATADLQGRRLVVVSETGEFGRLNAEQAKLLTGGDRLTGRRLYQAAFSFEPMHLLVMQTNHLPQVSDTGEGIWRRLRPVPFTVTIPPGQRDPELPEKLRGEPAGILAWLWQGWREYQRRGLRDVPAAVQAALAEYRSSSDQIGAWLADCCADDRAATTTAADLYQSYATWCAQQGERPRSQRDHGLRLRERGLVRERTRGGIRWQGLALTKSGIFGLREISGNSDVVKVH